MSVNFHSSRKEEPHYERKEEPKRYSYSEPYSRYSYKGESLLERQNTREKERTYQPERQQRKEIHQIPLKGQYIRLIQDGIKTVEGRIFSGQFLRVREKDEIVFFNQNQSIRCEVTAMKIYSTFADMIKQEGLNNLIPYCKSQEDGVRLYESFPGYAEKAKRYGVVALRLHLIS
ncbi:MAG: ASCH domain-containing protein [Chlamydiota bacterium]